MLDRAKSVYLPSASPFALPRLRNYVDDLSRHRRRISDRYSTAPGYVSGGVNLLRHILSIATDNGLFTYKDDLSRFTKLLTHIQKDMARTFDAVTLGNIRTNTFIQSSKGITCKEILIATRYINPITALPFGKDWEHWKHVKPVRLLDFDSGELTFKTYQDRVSFTEDPPTYAVIAIDPVALAMQFAAYHQYVEDVKRVGVTEYLHRYVLNYGIMRDLQNLWLRDRYITAITSNNKLNHYSVTNKLHKAGIYGYIGADYTVAMLSVDPLIDLAKSGQMAPATLLSSLCMSSGTISTYYQNLSLATNTMYIGVQSSWVEYVRDRKWLELSYHAHALNKSSVWYKNFINALRRDLPMMYDDSPWNFIRDPVLKALIKADLSDKMNNWIQR